MRMSSLPSDSALLSVALHEIGGLPCPRNSRTAVISSANLPNMCPWSAVMRGQASGQDGAWPPALPVPSPPRSRSATHARPAWKASSLVPGATDARTPSTRG